MASVFLLCAAVLCCAMSIATEMLEEPVTFMRELFEEDTVTGVSNGMRCGSNNCPPGWIKHGSRWFFFVNKEMTWTDAEIYCLASKGNLVSIHNPTEYAFIQRIVNNQTGTNTRAWIGGTDAVKSSVWFWSDGSRFFYKDWARGEPTNGEGHEHCIEINQSDDHLWNDRNCADRIPFICGTKPDESC